MRSFILSSTFAGLAAAAAAPYAQCGGNSWTGDTTCESGWTCTLQSEWYSQCLPGTTSTTLATSTTKTTTAPSSTTTVPSSTGAAGKLKWLGINLSVAEFGTGTYPGVWGTDFYFPSESAISVRTRSNTLAFDGEILTSYYRLS